MGFKGVDIRQSGDRVVIRASLKDSSGAKVTTGTASLYLYEVQSDGTLKSYDFSSNTFKTTALTTETASLTHRTGNNGTTNTGVWTYALTTVTGFTRGNVYIAVVSHSSASPAQQEREFQYGEGGGDFSVDSSGRPVAASVAGDVNGKILGNGVTDPAGPGVWALGDAGQNLANYDQIGVGGVNLTALGDARIGADTAGVTTLLSRFTAARAGYLDNLNVGGAVASSAQVQNIQNNTFVSTSVPEMLELPDSGSESISISILFNDETGSPKNLDSGNPTITLINNAGTDRSARLGGWTNPATGKYVTTYTNTAGDAIEGLHWDVTGTVNAKLRRAVKYTQLLDTTGVTFTASDRTKLTAIYTNADVATSTRLASSGYTAPPTAVQVRQEMDSNSTQLAAIVATQTAIKGAGWTTGDNMHQIRTDIGNVSGGGSYLARGSVVTTTGTTTTLDTGAVATGSYYVGDLLVITAGTGAGQDVVITGYTSGRTATHAAWTTNPDGTSTYEVRPGKSSATVTSGSAPTAQQNADAVVQALARTVAVTVVGIVNGQVIECVRADDYSVDASRVWSFEKIAGEPWPDDLTGHTITFTATKAAGNANAGDATVTFAGAVVTATGADQAVTLSPTAAQLSNLAVGVGAKGYDWDLVAISGGKKKTLRRGVMTVRENQTA